jgi:hypothetical protein
MRIKCNLVARLKRRLPVSTFGPLLAILVSLIGYLHDHDGSYRAYAHSLSFPQATHPNLDFPNSPKSTWAANSNMIFSTVQSDADVAAHAAGAKVVLYVSAGGSNQLIRQLYKAGLSTQLVDSLSSYLDAHNLDGIVLDVKDSHNKNLGTPGGPLFRQNEDDHIEKGTKPSLLLVPMSGDRTWPRQSPRRRNNPLLCQRDEDGLR